jgi:calcineurin-like phosphoesterase family protein
MQNYWFTADTHFGHANIIQYARRPFATVGEMDAALITNWNARVGETDLVFHLGDFAFRGGRERVLELTQQLHGHIHLIRGNHDHDAERGKQGFGWIKDLYMLKVPDADAPDGVQRIMLSHCAFRVWFHSHHGAWNLYGHSHDSLPDDPHALAFDVGVDAQNYAPISYAEVKARMATKQFVPVDHHDDE